MSEQATESRIVVGVDGSEPSKQALQWARFLAESTKSRLDAVSAWNFPAIVATDVSWPTDWQPEKDTQTLLHQTVTEVLGDQPSVPVREIVQQGNAAQVLLDASQGARMLVVGSRGHGGFAGLLLGSVSSACAEHAACPVLVVHDKTPQPPDQV